jgi:hypothetical protein
MGDSELTKTEKLMAALLRQPPKFHEDMKLGNATAKPAKSPAQKKPHGASAKPKNA